MEKSYKMISSHIKSNFICKKALIRKNTTIRFLNPFPPFVTTDLKEKYYIKVFIISKCRKHPLIIKKFVYIIFFIIEILLIKVKCDQ